MRVCCDGLAQRWPMIATFRALGPKNQALTTMEHFASGAKGQRFESSRAYQSFQSFTGFFHKASPPTYPPTSRLLDDLKACIVRSCASAALDRSQDNDPTRQTTPRPAAPWTSRIWDAADLGPRVQKAG